MIKPGTFIAFAIYVLLLQGCGKPHIVMTEQTFIVMGTVASVTLPYEEAAKLNNATQLVVDTMKSIEDKMSVYRADSELSLINMQADREPLLVSDNMFTLLEHVKYYSAISGGAFDVTVASLLKEWGLLGSASVLEYPLSGEILQNALRKVDWRHIILSEGTVFLNRPGVALDLGGIAKGYAIDLACQRLLEHGISNALINVGGDIRSLGYRRDKEPWIVGVRNPFRPTELLGTIELSGGEAVATSGNYERFVVIDGQRYTHIVDPRSGWPVKGMASVTVISRSAIEADALSTALFVLGEEQGVETLGKTASRAAMFVVDKQPVKMRITSDFARRFEPADAMRDRIFFLIEK